MTDPEPTPPRAIELPPRVVRYYGCTRCQRYHVEDDPLYGPHQMWQSKHGIREMARPGHFGRRIDPAGTTG